MTPSRPLVRRVRRLVVPAFVLVALVEAGCRSAGPSGVSTIERAAPAGSYDPARDLGPLFHDIQLAGVFPDSKTLVDARPRFAPAEIVARYASARRAGPVDLRAFVAEHFEAPRAAGEGVRTDTTQSMEE